MATSDAQAIAIESTVALYQNADRPTRTFIDAEIAAVRWRRRHGVLLEWAGLGSGVFITALFGVIAWDLIRSGAQVAGTILGTVDLVALAAVFVNGRKAT